MIVVKINKSGEKEVRCIHYPITWNAAIKNWIESINGKIKGNEI